MVLREALGALVLVQRLLRAFFMAAKGLMSVSFFMCRLFRATFFMGWAFWAKRMALKAAAALAAPAALALVTTGSGVARQIRSMPTRVYSATSNVRSSQVSSSVHSP